jgi:cation:H+ antiporter
VHGAKIGVAIILLGVYGFYVFKAITNSGEKGEEEELSALRFHRLLGGGEGSPPTWLCWSQVGAALGLIIAGAYLFVSEIEIVSHAMHIPALVLSLVIAPLATELPETFNSVIWVRESKDTLAMGNISGAMVFQGSVPVSIGVVFTEWELTTTALVSVAIALASAATAFYYIKRNGYISAPVLVRSGLLWIGFVIFVVGKTLVE